MRGLRRLLLEDLAIALGGAAGAVSRTVFLSLGWEPAWLLTGLVNLAGALLLASLYRKRVHLHPFLAAGVMTGFCGAFTTVSLWGSELRTLLVEGQAGLALLYAGLSLATALPLTLIILCGPSSSTAEVKR